MPAPGYDPDDVEDLLESKLVETDVRSHFADDEWRAYRNGEHRLSACSTRGTSPGC